MFKNVITNKKLPVAVVKVKCILTMHAKPGQVAKMNNTSCHGNVVSERNAID